MKNLEIALQLVTEPKAAFESLKAAPRFWFPLLTMVLSTILIFAWYFNIVDFAWLRDHMLNSIPNAEQMTEAQRTRAGAFITKNSLMWSTLMGAAIGLPVVRLIEGIYYLLTGMMTKVQGLTFKQWFSLACWTGLPAIISLIPMMILLFMRSNGQIGMESLSILSLNELFFHIPAGQKWQSLLSGITILQPWIWWLSYVGVKVFTGRGTAYCVLVVAIPFTLIYGCWAAFSAFFG